MKFDSIRVPEKNAWSTAALSKPDIGPQSRPNARAAIMRYPPCKLPLRIAVTSASPGLRNTWRIISAPRGKQFRHRFRKCKVVPDDHRDRRRQDFGSI